MAAPIRSSLPDAAHSELCNLPAVGGWVLWDYEIAGKPKHLEAVPHCRFHDQPARAAAADRARALGPKVHVFPTTYTGGGGLYGPTCKLDRNPVQLGEVLDRERIDQAAEAVRAALRELTALTTNAYGHSFEIGNESAVLRALQELGDDVEDEVGTVARRLAARTSWQRVADLGSMTRLDRPSTARAAWLEWGGGPGDDEPPTAA